MIQQFTAPQMREIMSRTAEALQKNKSLASADFSLGCIACEAGLNVAAGAILAGIVAAGVFVSPEAAAVLVIAEATGLGAGTVALIINTALGAGVGATVETIISDLCGAMGAC